MYRFKVAVQVHAVAAEFSEGDGVSAVGAGEQGAEAKRARGGRRLEGEAVGAVLGPLCARSLESRPSHIDCDPPHRHTK